MLDRVGSQVCVFSTLCRYPCCVCLHCTVSNAYTSVHNLATHMCTHLPYNFHLPSLKWARLRHTKVACHTSWIVVAPALTDLETSTIYYFTLVAELRSSAMSGATDRREEEHVPQFFGRIEEKFAEWETDVRLWQVEFKLEDRVRLGPRLYRRGLHGQPEIIVKTKLGTKDVSQFTVDNIIQCLKDNRYGAAS